MTKLRPSWDETRLDRTEHSVLDPESWTNGVDFGTSLKGGISATVAVDKWHSGFTPSEQCALHSFRANYAIKRFNTLRAGLRYIRTWISA